MITARPWVVGSNETNMSVRLSDTIREYLGWCPNVQARSSRRLAVPSSEQATTSPEGGGISSLSFKWYSEVRVQMFILGILMCAFVLWGTPAYDSLWIIRVIIGAIVVIPLAGITIIGYQKFFAEVVKYGTGNEMIWCKGRGRNIFLLGLIYLVLIAGFNFSIVLGWIPGLDRTFLNGFVPGFVIAYVILYLLFLILWERTAGRRMYTKWPLYYARKES